MKYLVLVVFLVLTGCAQFTPVCRHAAVSCALMAQEEYGPARVEIAVGPSGSVDQPQRLYGGEYHAQARVYTGDDWKWLSTGPFGCSFSKKDNFFAPTAFYSTKDFIDKYWH